MSAAPSNKTPPHTDTVNTNNALNPKFNNWIKQPCSKHTEQREYLITHTEDTDVYHEYPTFYIGDAYDIKYLEEHSEEYSSELDAFNSRTVGKGVYPDE
jgi:hypothetical protein